MKEPASYNLKAWQRLTRQARALYMSIDPTESAKAERIKLMAEARYMRRKASLGNGMAEWGINVPDRPAVYAQANEDWEAYCNLYASYQECKAEMRLPDTSPTPAASYPVDLPF
jgi:hypothetical protein